MTARLPVALFLLASLAVAPHPLTAQRPSVRTRRAATGSRPAAPQGIWEPVGYGEDVELNDVYFVTPEEGWVAGGNGTANGVLLHTSDAGTNWEVVLGDPAGSQRPFYHLRFVDQTTGFVAQGTGVGDHKLLRTTDGSTWTVTGTVPQHHTDFRFVSATDGVAAAGSAILRTTDAGRNWQPVFECALKLQVDGLTKTVGCAVASFAFASPSRGYAVGGSYDVRGVYVFRTDDSGASWTGRLAVPDVHGEESHIFFTSEATGYICTQDGSLFGTTDGGVSWAGLPGASCESKAPLLFADPEVGWAFRYTTMTYTTTGGKRWVSRDIPLPAAATAFSLPRRDRAYVVGDHGMVFRYRVVPAGTTVPNAIAAPAMPGVSTALDSSLDRMEGQLATFDSLVQAMPDSSASSAGSDAGGGSGGFEQDTSTAFLQEPPGAFAAACCGKPLSTFDLVFQAVGSLVPGFLSRFRNLNLLVQAIRTGVQLPQMAGELRSAYHSFRSAGDRPTAAAALDRIKMALGGLRAAVDTAMQTRTEETP